MNYKILLSILFISLGVNSYGMTYNSEYQERAMLNAANVGDIKVLTAWLDKGVNINAQDRYGYTALIWAAYKGHKEIVALLLDKGATSDAQNDSHCTALMEAVRHGHEEVVKMLLAKGANINAQNTSGDTALSWAVEKGYKEIVTLLLDKGADINAQSLGGRTVLLQAISNGNKEIVTLLLDKGADINININAKNAYSTPLMTAIAQGKIEIAEILITKGADIKVQNSNEYLHLFWAVSHSHKEIATLLLERGADINVHDTKGDTALMQAASNGNKEMIVFLLDKGADTNAQNKLGDTALGLALKMDHEEIVRILLSRQSIPKRPIFFTLPPIATSSIVNNQGNKDSKRCTICLEDYQQDENLEALPCGHVFHGYCVSSLTKASARCPLCRLLPAAFDAATFDVRLLIMTAANDCEGVRQALKQGASINAQNQEGYTPLFIAATSGYTDIVYLLLTHTDINTLQGLEQSLQSAVKNNHKVIVRLLLGYGALVDNTDSVLTHTLGKIIDNPLMLAAVVGNVSEVKRLLSQDVELSVLQDTLLLASAQGHLSIVEHLIPLFINRRECAFFEQEPLRRLRLVLARSQKEDQKERYRHIERLLLAASPLPLKPISTSLLRLS